MFISLSAVLCVAAFATWINPRRFSGFTLALFVSFTLFAVDRYFGLADLPDSAEYVSFFAGENYQYGAESWLFSMRLYAWVINSLSLGMLAPESMLLFARLLNLALYLFFFCLICRRSLMQLSIICTYFYTSLLAYNCIFQIRAGFAYVLMLFLLYLLFGRRICFGEDIEVGAKSFILSDIVDNMSAMRFSNNVVLTAPSIFIVPRIFRVLFSFPLVRLLSAFFLTCFIILIHSSSLVFLFCGLAVYGWAFFARRLQQGSSSLAVVVLLWSSVLGILVYFLVTRFLDLYVPFLSDLDFANSAFSLAGEADYGSGYGLLVLSIRSIFFIYLGCLYVSLSRSELSYYLAFPMILYGIFRPAFSAFFSFARILSPILILQLFVLAASRSYLSGSLRLLVSGFVLIFLMFAQAYALAPILDQKYLFQLN